MSELGSVAAFFIGAITIIHTHTPRPETDQESHDLDVLGVDWSVKLVFGHAKVNTRAVFSLSCVRAYVHACADIRSILNR